MYDYDEVYAYLSEKHFEDIESLMIDMENGQLLGEDAFLLDSLMPKTKENAALEKVKKPTNPIQM